MNGPDNVRPGDIEDLVAAFVPLEVVEGEVAGLQHGAHSPVGDDHAAAQGSAQGGGYWAGSAEG